MVTGGARAGAWGAQQRVCGGAPGVAAPARRRPRCLIGGEPVPSWHAGRRAARAGSGSQARWRRRGCGARFGQGCGWGWGCGRQRKGQPANSWGQARCLAACHGLGQQPGQRGRGIRRRDAGRVGAPSRQTREADTRGWACRAGAWLVVGCGRGWHPHARLGGSRRWGHGGQGRMADGAGHRMGRVWIYSRSVARAKEHGVHGGVCHPACLYSRVSPQPPSHAHAAGGKTKRWACTAGAAPPRRRPQNRPQPGRTSCSAARQQNGKRGSTSRRRPGPPSPPPLEHGVLA